MNSFQWSSCTIALAFLAIVKAFRTGKMLDSLSKEGVVTDLSSGEFIMALQCYLEDKLLTPHQLPSEERNRVTRIYFIGI